MKTGRETKGKAIFVDGASANGNKASLGIQRYNFHGLYDVLVNKVGTSASLFCAPRITVSPEMAASNYGIIKDLAGAGFEAVPVTTRNGADDAELRRLIQELSPRDVSEIVIFTSDKDFVPVLREKAGRGIRIYWVATKRHDPALRRHRLSMDVITLCTRPGFTFVELGDYLPHIDDDSSPASTPLDDMVVTIRLPTRNWTVRRRLTSEIEHLAAQFDGLTFQIEG